MDNSVLLTIIVPIYNVEKFLKECLDSFTDQSDKNFDVILVNDGSTDGSENIIKDYLNRYPNLFTYIKQENKGLGGARNTGLKAAKSKYIMFFDSDDFMADKAVENINKTASETDTDIIFFNPVIYNMASNTYEPWHDGQLMKSIFSKNKVINPKENPILHETEASVCRAVYKREFLERINLKFIERVHWEDVPPHFLMMHEAKNAAFLDYEGAYFYRFNSGNQITSSTGKDRLDMAIIFNEIKPYFTSKEWSKREKSHMLGFLSNYLFWSLHVIDDKYRVEFVDICHSFIKDISFGQYMNFFFKSKVCLRNKLMMYFFKSNRKYKTFYSMENVSKKMKIFKLFKRK